MYILEYGSATATYFLECPTCTEPNSSPLLSLAYRWSRSSCGDLESSVRHAVFSTLYGTFQKNYVVVLAMSSVMARRSAWRCLTAVPRLPLSSMVLGVCATRRIYPECTSKQRIWHEWVFFLALKNLATVQCRTVKKHRESVLYHFPVLKKGLIK